MNNRVIWRVLDKYFCLPILVILSLPNKVISLLKFSKTLEKKYVKKILIIKLAALGDTILLIPILRVIRAKFPGSKIEMLVTGINSGAVENCPYIDELRFFDINSQIKSPFLFLRLIRILRKEKFDIIFDFEQRIRISALITHFIKAKRSFGFNTKGYFRHYLYTNVVAHRKDQHELECYCDLVREITGEIIDKKLGFWIPENDRFWAKEFLKGILGNKKIIVLHPGCGGNLNRGGRAREWPRENFIELINRLCWDNIQFIISGGENEVNLAEYIASKVKIKPIVITGKLSISQLAAILELSNLLISSDTGIMHLAAAIGVNLIALFGPTDPKRCKPLTTNINIVRSNLNCSPCQYFGIDNPKCNDFKCMLSITPDDVLKTIKAII